MMPSDSELFGETYGQLPFVIKITITMAVGYSLAYAIQYGLGIHISLALFIVSVTSFPILNVIAYIRRNYILA